jgi:predicted nucleotidyltransferase
MLEGLFTSGARVKILGFLFFVKDESHIREISRETKTPVSAVSREVDNLASLGIISKDNNVLRLNKGSPIIGDLKNIFIKTDYVIYPLKDALKGLEADYAFVYGSFAKGDYTEKSDLDLFVVGAISQKDVLKLIKPAEEAVKREINAVVWPLSDLKKKNAGSFVKDIAKNKILMIKGSLDELRQIIG